MSFKYLIAMAFVLLAQTATAGIYKWVDDKGVTHFSEKPPAERSVDKVKVSASGVKSKAMGADPYARLIKEAEAEKEIDVVTKVVAGALVNQLMQVSEEETVLNCKKAVKNGQHWAAVMRKTAKKNYQDGYITDDRQRKMAQSLNKAQKSMTVSNCEQASGKEIDFYRCLSNDDNHLIACDRLH